MQDDHLLLALAANLTTVTSPAARAGPLILHVILSRSYVFDYRYANASREYRSMDLMLMNRHCVKRLQKCSLKEKKIPSVPDWPPQTISE